MGTMVISLVISHTLKSVLNPQSMSLVASIFSSLSLIIIDDHYVTFHAHLLKSQINRNLSVEVVAYFFILSFIVAGSRNSRRFMRRSGATWKTSRTGWVNVPWNKRRRDYLDDDNDPSPALLLPLLLYIHSWLLTLAYAGNLMAC